MKYLILKEIQIKKKMRLSRKFNLQKTEMSLHLSNKSQTKLRKHETMISTKKIFKSKERKIIFKLINFLKNRNIN